MKKVNKITLKLQPKLLKTLIAQLENKIMAHFPLMAARTFICIWKYIFMASEYSIQDKYSTYVLDINMHDFIAKEHNSLCFPVTPFQISYCSKIEKVDTIFECALV